MSVGIVMLAHTALHRAEQVARHWVAAGCPVVIHVDRNVPRSEYQDFEARFAGTEQVLFCRRHRCEWGAWGIVAASLSASELMLQRFPNVGHVYLTSGACLPLRPVAELIDYLEARPQTDFIESATTAEVPWTVGGLDEERFTLRFPFAWKKNRQLFDKAVDIQRALGLKRRLPTGLVPHMGSQWWCLTRQTLSAILQAPDRARFERFFRHVWIPDESYFQSLARRYSSRIESRSLTLSKFDFQGKPHIFYDDHLQLLRRSDCFLARKIWPQADLLYHAFLHEGAAALKHTEPNPGKIDRIFSKAVDRRTRGRPGLYMQSRHPNRDWENGITTGPYSVFEGFAELFENFDSWLSRVTGSRVHGHLFAPERVEFANGACLIDGALSDSAAARDYDPEGFLTNLMWNTRGERQCFQFGPGDRQDITWLLTRDPNAQILVISGAWAVPLFHSNRNFGELRRHAARLQKVESSHLHALRAPHVKARVKIWTMADFMEAPMEALQSVVDEIGPVSPRRLTEAPVLANLEGFGQFLQNLKNQGMHPYLMGDFPVEDVVSDLPDQPRRPYLVR